MPPAEIPIDPEKLLRDAISGIAVTAYSRGINITTHIDNRLPSRVICAEAALGDFLRRGLQRTVGAGRTTKIALALWSSEADPDGTGRMQVEICRARVAGNPPISQLADIWALPLENALVQPVRRGQDSAADSVRVTVPMRPVPGAQTVGQLWGRRFQGRRVLHVRDVVFDPARLRHSMDVLGLEMHFTLTPDKALAILRAAVAEGRPIDLIALDGHLLGDVAVKLAREIRADPELNKTRIVLASAIPGPGDTGHDTALFDSMPWTAVPGRRLLDVLYDLVGTPAGTKTGTEAADSPANAIPALAGRRILVAEDVGTNQVMLQAVLAPTGARVEVVGDGAEAVKRHREDPADLILMDLQMPGIGGIAALRMIREMDGAAGAVRVLALTAYARSADRRMALRAGMDAYLAKPIVVAEFYHLLRDLLPEAPT